MDWLPAARAGSSEALGNTLESCRRYLLWVARRELGSDLQAKAGASDLVQETLLDAGRDFARFHGGCEEELLAWLRRILLNNLSNFFRSYRGTAKRCVAAEVPLDDVDPSGEHDDGLTARSSTPAEQAMEREQVQLLEEAVAKLPEDQRRLITLWHREEKSFEEIARILGCSPNTVRARWLHAIKRLQRDLQADLETATVPAASSKGVWPGRQSSGPDSAQHSPSSPWDGNRGASKGQEVPGERTEQTP
jgi:RNA polymerase sigma-70 factor (ECF subfamily)